MFRLFRWILAAAAASTLLTACGGDDDPAPLPTLAQAAQSGGFTALNAAATKAGTPSHTTTAP